MSYIPITSSTAPSHEMKTLFAKRHSSDSSSNYYLSEFNFKSKYPIVNLDNFKDVLDIDCSTASVSKDTKDTIKIIMSGENKKLKDGLRKGVVAMFGHHWGCGNEVNFRMVESISFNPSINTMVIHGKSTDLSSIALSYDLNVDHLDSLPSHYHNAMSSLDRRLRRRQLRKREESSKSFQTDLNYDRSASKASKPIDFGTSDGVNSRCDNCYVKGDALFKFATRNRALDGTPEEDVSPNWNLTLTGDLRVNADYVMELTNKPDGQEKTKLTTVNLGGISVPGLFEVGLTFVLRTSGSVTLNDTTLVNWGFDATWSNYYVGVHHPRGKILPRFTTQGLSPVVTPHNTKLPSTLSLSAKLTLSPTFQVGALIGNKWQVGFGLGMDHEIYTDANPGDGEHCQSRELQILPTFKNRVKARVGIHDFTLYESQKGMYCKTCVVCVKDYPDEWEYIMGKKPWPPEVEYIDGEFVTIHRATPNENQWKKRIEKSHPIEDWSSDTDLDFESDDDTKTDDDHLDRWDREREREREREEKAERENREREERKERENREREEQKEREKREREKEAEEKEAEKLKAKEEKESKEKEEKKVKDDTWDFSKWID
ncbi:hypothetical protein BKA69DRAFT_1051905 [Paraphysoderma sedebokerense]|nr:hypothetical protein BKA69DRAFT_1051905 [Paraphysoderma sedebokerense]